MAVTHLPNDISANSGPELDADVIVVGAGPAGSAAAYYLALAKRKVLLIEQQKFPREKIAADFVSPGAIRELQRIGIADLPEFKNHNIINQAAIYLNGEMLVSGEFPVFPDLVQYGQVVSRKVLDSLILDAARRAGTAIVESMRVIECRVENDGVSVVAEDLKGRRIFRSRLLIGADGNHSVVARLLRDSSWSAANRGVVVRGYVNNVVGAPNQATVCYNSESFPGYSWIFPTNKSQANVGVGTVLEATPPTEPPKELLTRLVTADEGMHSRLEHATLQDEPKVGYLNLYDPQLPIVGNRVMLIGEAAGLVNPFNGEGTQFALISGRWASKTALSAIENNDFSEAALSGYPERIKNELSYGFQVSTLMLQLIRNRNLNPIWLQALKIMGNRSKADPYYAALTSGILSGMIFPDQETTAKIIIGAIQEATVTTGITTFANILSNPATLPVTILQATQLGIEIAQSTLQNPFSFLQWSIETTATAAFLTAAAPLHVLKEANRPAENK